jgi:hypothetical protein
MQGMLLPFQVHLHGTLAANASGRFKLPVAATLMEISASASNNSDATLQVGTAADDDGLLTATAIGDSEAVVTFDRDDWNGALYPDVENIDYPRFAEDTVIEWVLDFDGASGTAAQNVSITFVFIEG